MITTEIFEKLFPSKGLNPGKYNLVRNRRELIDALNEFLPAYEINTYRRVSAFLATCGIETDYFKTSTEYASGADYEGRRDLGNTVKGDGRRFRGRGIIQTTGRDNYERVQRRIGKRLGINVIENPERLAEVRIAVESACIFWQENNLNFYADAKEFKQLNGIVNRGNPNKTPLHWDKRNELYSKCIRYIPQTFAFVNEAETQDAANQLMPIVTPAPGGTVTSENYDDPLRLVEDYNLDLTSAEPSSNARAAAADLSANENSKIKEYADKYLKHCKTDSFKNALTVVSGRIFGALTTAWCSGITGKILIAVAVAPIFYALYYYRARITGWIKTIADSFANQS